MPDDPTIAPGTLLYRRIHPVHHVKWDDNKQCKRFTSGAFQNATEPPGTRSCSIALSDTLEAAGRDPQSVLDAAQTPDWFLVSIVATAARAEGQELERRPTPEEPAHGHVVGEKGDRVKRALARAARWVIAPPDSCPDKAAQ